MPRQPSEITVEGDVAYIELTRGRRAIIDAADVPIVRPFRWHAFRPNKISATDYVGAAAVNAAGVNTTLYLHRLITGAPKGKTVDHLNHDGLDNRRANLRVGGQRENLQNRRGANSNSTTGVRGVHVHPTFNRRKNWRGTYYNARVMRDGRSKTKNFPYTPAGFEAACAWVASERGET